MCYSIADRQAPERIIDGGSRLPGVPVTAGYRTTVKVSSQRQTVVFRRTGGWLLLRLFFAGMCPDRRGLDALPPRYGSFAL